MAKKDYIERSLIKLKRQYGKDEYVSHLLKEASEKDIEIGKLHSEIDELQHELYTDQEAKQITRQARTHARKEELYISIRKRNVKLQKQVRELRKLRDNLMSKINTQ